MVVSARRHHHAHLPRRRSGHTTSVTIGAELFCLTANQRDDGSLGEVFIDWGKHGTRSAAGEHLRRRLVARPAASRPLGELIRPGLDQFFVPNGHTDDPEIPRVRSAVDYIARRLAIDWLPYAERAELGVYTLTERVHRASTWITALRAEQPGGQHLEHLAEGGGEVQPHRGQRRVGGVGGQHRGRRLGVRPHRGGRHDGRAGQPERVGLAEFGHGPRAARRRAR